MTNFFPAEYCTVSSKRKFGICDTTPQEPAFLDENHGKNWIAVIENPHQDEISFIPIDNCIVIRRENGMMDNRCDGMLYRESTIVFIELKERSGKGNKWIHEGEHQLQVTIFHFEQTPDAEQFAIKKAYIANRKKPTFKRGQSIRTQRFYDETGYILYIENRIEF